MYNYYNEEVRVVSLALLPVHGVSFQFVNAVAWTEPTGRSTSMPLLKRPLRRRIHTSAQ
jgi:hypothetical protein